MVAQDGRSEVYRVIKGTARIEGNLAAPKSFVATEPPLKRAMPAAPAALTMPSAPAIHRLRESIARDIPFQARSITLRILLRRRTQSQATLPPGDVNGPQAYCLFMPQRGTTLPGRAAFVSVAENASSRTSAHDRKPLLHRPRQEPGELSAADAFGTAGARRVGLPEPHGHHSRLAAHQLCRVLRPRPPPRLRPRRPRHRTRRHGVR